MSSNLKKITENMNVSQGEDSFVPKHFISA